MVRTRVDKSHPSRTHLGPNGSALESPWTILQYCLVCWFKADYVSCFEILQSSPFILHLQVGVKIAQT